MMVLKAPPIKAFEMYDVPHKRNITRATRKKPDSANPVFVNEIFIIFLRADSFTVPHKFMYVFT